MTDVPVRPLPPPSAAPSPSTPQTLAEATRCLNSWIEVDLDAMRDNVAALQRAVGPGVELIAVVKANAYGLGVEGLALPLEAAGVARFAVVSMPEALALRALGVTRPIVVLGHCFPADAAAAVAAGITVACHSLAVGEALSEAAVAQGRTAQVHIHIDSGLHREGVTADEAVALAPKLRGLPGIEVHGMSTHMANADEPDDSYSLHQRAEFERVVAALPWVPYRHAANSATALRRPELRYEGVRLGLSLHGVLPENTPDPGLRPVLSLKARLARVSALAEGDGVSYGLTWRAPRPSLVALVPVGYADGWRRALGNRGEVLVQGRRCPIVGRVMMDQFVVDVTGLPEPPREGDECVLIGGQGGGRITADEVAAKAETIPWDILASLQPRTPRLFHRGGLVVPPPAPE